MLSVQITQKSILSVFIAIKNACDQLLDGEKSFTGTLDILYSLNWKNLLNIFSGEFESIFPSKKSMEEQSCFSQDLCPQMASYSRLWA